MATFTISRLDTAQGTFRLMGKWTRPGEYHARTSGELTIHSLDIMGTDGWVALKQQSNTELIDKLRDEILLHLQSKQSEASQK